MHHATARKIMMVSTSVYVAIGVLLFLIRAVIVLGVISLIWLILHIVLSFFARCPNCGRFPGRGYMGEQFCPNCGEPLD